MADGGRMATSSQALVSVAMLKVSLDQEGRDYIDQLNSFVKESLPVQGQAVDVGRLTANIFEQFGLRIPAQVVESALRRLAKKGVIARDHSIYVVAQPTRDEGFTVRRQRAIEDIAKVVSAFQAFYEDSFSSSISERGAQDALVSFVSRNSIECLRTYVYRTPFPKISHDTQQSYAVARFINSAHEERPELFKLILVVFKGVMLANAFTCPDLDSISKKFDGVDFYLDTPLVLSLLKLHGATDSRKLEDLVGLLCALNGKVCVFEHTLDEVDAVLAWCEAAVQKKGSSSRVVQALIAEGKGQSDLILMRAGAREKLGELGVLIRATPPYVEHLQIDETVLEGILTQEVLYPRERAIQYDINSVRSIYALRKGTSPRRLEEAKAVFVTSNASFARAAFAYSRNFEVAKRVSPVITDYSAANIAWLKSPMGAVELPRHELLAMCFAALAPSDVLWNKFLGAAETLHKSGKISSDELAVLRSDGSARQDMMDLTLGADEDFKAEDVHVVLDRLRRRLVAEKDKDIQGKQVVIDEFRRELDAASQARDVLIRQTRDIGEGIRGRAFKNAKRLLLTIWFLLAATTVALPFFTPRDGAPFWICLGCLALITAGPIALRFLGVDLLERIPVRWSDHRWSRWVAQSVPKGLLQDGSLAAGAKESN